MTNQFETLQKISTDHIESITASGEVLAKGFKSIAEETAGYTKRSITSITEFVEKFKDLKSFEGAIQLQTDFTKSQFEDFMGQMAKIGEIYKGMGTEFFKPVKAFATASKDTVIQ